MYIYIYIYITKVLCAPPPFQCWELTSMCPSCRPDMIPSTFDAGSSPACIQSIGPDVIPKSGSELPYWIWCPWQARQSKYMNPEQFYGIHGNCMNPWKFHESMEIQWIHWNSMKSTHTWYSIICRRPQWKNSRLAPRRGQAPYNTHPYGIIFPCTIGLAPWFVDAQLLAVALLPAPRDGPTMWAGHSRGGGISAIAVDVLGWTLRRLVQFFCCRSIQVVDNCFLVWIHSCSGQINADIDVLVKCEADR